MKRKQNPGYDCWLRYERVAEPHALQEYRAWCGGIVVTEDTPVIRTAVSELRRGLAGMLGRRPGVYGTLQEPHSIILGTMDGCPLLADSVTEEERLAAEREGFVLKTLTSDDYGFLIVAGGSGRGVLYGVFELLSRIRRGLPLDELHAVEKPASPLRIIDQWDNMDGKIERGYAGRSILWKGNTFSRNLSRIGDYARLLASVGINGIVLNNVNVHEREARLIEPECREGLARFARIFREYGIRVFLSVSFAGPMRTGGLSTADPLDPAVREWWKRKADALYTAIPDFGGFLVKADSEFNPGPFAWGRTHAEGANMLADVLAPYGGIVFWRCFVYNCTQDWRDRVTDRAKAAYENFMPFDGRFRDNVVLQIKNGPMDFQVREPVSPLLGAMESTGQCLELQITQEYTGQQIHLCYLVPQWKDILEFDTHVRGPGSTVARAVGGSPFGKLSSGIAGVSNIGEDPNWTGHPLAQANLYGFGRLAWNPYLSSEAVTDEWVKRTFGCDETVVSAVTGMLLRSWRIYENYTAPLGVGWMVNPNHHYGPSVDGYEYSAWGTYHRADHHGIGVDRTMRSGTGFTNQYRVPNNALYESKETCPEELLLFFHHVPYLHRLSSGKTVIQHIYDTHFDGAAMAAGLLGEWEGLRDRIDPGIFEAARKRFAEQAKHALEWRDVINSYFFRKSGIPDEEGRVIF